MLGTKDKRIKITTLGKSNKPTTFKKAFRKARAENKKTFMWNGKKYITELKKESSKKIKKDSSKKKMTVKDDRFSSAVKTTTDKPDRPDRFSGAVERRDIDSFGGVNKAIADAKREQSLFRTPVMRQNKGGKLSEGSKLVAKQYGGKIGK
jgi:hypothetical protein